MASVVIEGGYRLDVATMTVVPNDRLVIADGMIVENGSRYTYATYRLNDPEEVDQFLRHLSNFMRSALT